MMSRVSCTKVALLAAFALAAVCSPAFAVDEWNMPFPLSEWHHAAATCDGCGSVTGIRIYVDGARRDDNSAWNDPAPFVTNIGAGGADDATRHEWVFVDTTVAGYQDFVDDLLAGGIDGRRDGGVTPTDGAAPVILAEESHLVFPSSEGSD